MGYSERKVGSAVGEVSDDGAWARSIAGASEAGADVVDVQWLSASASSSATVATKRPITAPAATGRASSRLMVVSFRVGESMTPSDHDVSVGDLWSPKTVLAIAESEVG